MKKIILGYVIPYTLIGVIFGYFAYLKFQTPKSEMSFYELQWVLFKENWLICLIGITAFFYIQIIVPKIFKK